MVSIVGIKERIGDFGPRLELLRVRLFDVLNGVETLEQVQQSDLDMPEKARNAAERYQPTKISVFNDAIAAIPETDLSKFAFVDFGSGKGLCLLLAAKAGFGRLIGIELSPSLCLASRKNLKSFRRGQFEKIAEVQNESAPEANLPDQSSVFYFYNPFNEQLMTKTLESIKRHLEAATSESYLVYINPKHANVVAYSGFELIASGTKCREEWTIWRRPICSEKEVRD